MDHRHKALSATGRRRSAPASLGMTASAVIRQDVAVPVIRAAAEADLAAILALIDADPISAGRRGHGVAVTGAVRAAFAEIQQSSAHSLWVVEEAGQVLGSYQLSLLPGLARGGMRRAIIESVHVRADWRSRGLGEALLRHAVERSREAGCGSLQLTTDKRRTAAHRFYRRLGFVASHEGMKLDLTGGDD